jgi:predicted transcriptional regulator
MTQASIYKLLKRKKSEMSTKEIAEKLKLSGSSVSRSLNGLLGSRSVIFTYKKDKVFKKFWKAT